MTDASTTVVRAATVLAESGRLSDAEVVVTGDTIVAVRPATGAVTYDVLAPGFVDLQMNGMATVDVAAADGDDWDVLDAGLLAQGVTTWCPTLVSAPLTSMEAAVRRIRWAAARPPGPRPDIAGAHLEGPFLAVPGAHPPEHLRPSVDERWLGSLLPDVAVVTLAPELPGAIGAVANLTAKGVLVSLGHSACSVEVARQAADAGAGLVTHLGNAMGPFSQRQPGLFGAALSDDRLAASLIADLVHVHPAFLTIAFRAKGPTRTALVTDAVATGSTAVADGPPRMTDGTLVGSVLTMDRALSNTVRVAGVALADAVAAASTTPARLLGLVDRGVIAPGRRADLVALGPALDVVAVWIAGRTAWPVPT
jgi:N-acetylglucosamine-6-phosphate deacetylase